MADVIDLRSDTVTRPGAAMRAAMADAEVGDDVYGEDPTVRELERTVAELFGRDGALFVPSGTMGNQVALRLHASPGEEVFCDAGAHIVYYEAGAAAAYGGIQTRTAVGERGLLDPDVVAEQIQPADHGVPTRAVAVEQTHNRGGGSVYPLEQLRRIREAATAAGAGMHCDGARIWNAHAATGTPFTAYGALFETLSVCLSKGLGAPVGSVLICDAARLEEARRIRRRSGGGMRQAGIIAAAGLYAVRHHIDRLADDHANARALAATLRERGLAADEPETNIVLLRLDGIDAASAAAKCAEAGVLVAVFGARLIRLVTHLDVNAADCARAADVISAQLGA